MKTSTTKTDLSCSCATHGDGSTTSMLCPLHADSDPCATMASVTGKRRKGSIGKGICSACGWREPVNALFLWGYNGSGLPMRTAVKILDDPAERANDSLRFTISFDNGAPRKVDALNGEVDNGDGTWTVSSFGGTLTDPGSFVPPAGFNWLD
jgi:hypothetical protein